MVGEIPVVRASRTDADRVLTVLVDLAQHVDELTLDEVDGEFFYRTLPEFAETVAEARQRCLGWVNSTPPEVRWADVAAVERDWGLVQPGAVGHVVVGRRLRMREPEVQGGFRFDRVTQRLVFDRVRIEVRSSDWTGADLARCYEEWAAPLEEFLQHRRDPNQCTTGLKFTYREEQLVVGPKGAVRKPACVLACIDVPALSAQTIAVNFDAQVRDYWQWHRCLPSPAPRADILARVRTWGIGLLMGAGWSFDRAWSRVADLLAVPEDGLSQEADRQHRQRLMADVPEAKNRLTARRRAQ